MNKQRTPGYYWASLVNAEWEIMYWTGTCWNHETGFDDTKMGRINENRILSPDETKKTNLLIHEHYVNNESGNYSKYAQSMSVTDLSGTDLTPMDVQRAIRDAVHKLLDKPKLRFIDEDAIKDRVSTYASPNKDEPVVLGYTTDAPRDNFDRASQNRQTNSCDVAPNPYGPWAKGICSCAPNYIGGWPRFPPAGCEMTEDEFDRRMKLGGILKSVSPIAPEQSCSCAPNYGEGQGCGAKESLKCYLEAQEAREAAEQAANDSMQLHYSAQEYAKKVKEETQAHREKQIAETVKNSKECISSTRNRLPSIINAILGK